MAHDELYVLDKMRAIKAREDFRAERKAVNDNHPGDNERGIILAELVRLKAELEGDRKTVAHDEQANQRPAELLRRQLRDVIRRF